MTQDLYYYESGYIEDGYISYVADAEASFDLTCNLSATGSVIKESSVSLTSTFNQTCTLSSLNGSDMFAFSNASLAAEVSRIRDNNTQVSSVFDIATQGMRVRYVSAQCDTDAAISFDYTRVREDETAFDAVFSSTVTANKIIEFNSVIDSSFSSSITCNPIREFNSVQTCVFELSVETISYNDVMVDLTSYFTQVTNSNKIIEFNVNLADAFIPTITCNPLRNLFAQLDLTTSLSVTPDYTKGAISNLQSNFTETVNAKFRFSQIANLQSTASINASIAFANKRPRAITPIGTYEFGNPNGTSVYGTGVTPTNYLRIENKSKTPIATNQDFYITVTVFENFGSNTSGSYIPIIDNIQWQIGYKYDTVNFIYNFYFYYNGTYILVSNISIGSGSHYHNIIVSRTNGTITLRNKTIGYGPSYDTVATAYNASALTPTQDYIKVNSGYVEELFFTIGENHVYNYSSNGQIADGWRTTTQFLYHFNNNFIDDMAGGTITNTVALVSQATIIANAGKSVVSIANLNSNATLVCTPQFMPLEFDASLNSEFSQTLFANKLIHFVSQMDSLSNTTIDNQRIRETTSAFDSIATELVAIGRIGNFFINCEVNTNITVNAIKTTDQLINFESTASISETLVRIRTLDSTILTIATVNATLTKVIEFNAQLSSQISITAVETKIIAFTSQQSISTELYASNGNIVVIQSQLNTNASLITTVNPIRRSDAILNQTVTMVCNSRRIRTMVSIQSSQLTFINQLVRIRKTSITMDAFVTQLTAIAKKVNEVSSMNVESTLSVTATVIVGRIQATLISNFGLAITENRIRTNHSNLQSTFISVIRISKSISTNAVMMSQTSMIAIGTRFYLDPDLTFIITRESREWIIASEDRSIIIENEDRTFIIGK